MATLLSSHPYTATDAGTGVTADSLAAWDLTRPRFSQFVSADLAWPADGHGEPYAQTGDDVLVFPSLILTDTQGRTLALNGVACGYRGEGPRGAAYILVVEGLLESADALDRIERVTSAVFGHRSWIVSEGTDRSGSTG